MYIQITTRCNMTCGHCCFDCKAYGEDMSFEVFKKAVDLSGDMLAIGGGEPTVHPMFDQFLLYAIGNSHDVWLATNGKLTDKALVLAKLAKKGVIACELSQDSYHDEIDQAVIAAFTKSVQNAPDGDLRGIRCVEGKEVAAGRCKSEHKGCPCPDFIAKPNGAIVQCGCSDAPVVGNVLSDDNEDFWNREADCHKTRLNVTYRNEY